MPTTTRSSRTASRRPADLGYPRPRRYRLSPEGRERLLSAALQNKPWEKSTGPRTAEGKARSARNSRPRSDQPCIRELRAELAGVFALVSRMEATRRLLSK